MKKLLLISLFLFCSILSAQNYYEVPYVGTKSKLTKLSETEADVFLRKYGIQKEFLMQEKEDSGFSEHKPFPAIVNSVYREDIPNENNETVLTAYRVMYNFIDYDGQRTTCRINLDDKETERFNMGQKIYFINNETAELYFEEIYYGNLSYWSTNASGTTAQNLQFKIDSGFIYTFNIKLAHYFHDFYMGLDTDRTEEHKFSEFEVYKDKISDVMKKSKFAYIPEMEYLPLIDKNNPFRYSLQNAFDGDAATSYVPKTDNEKIRLSINFDEKNVKQDNEIIKIMIVNGYASSEELYKKNNRIREVRYAYTKEKKPITFILKETTNKQYIEVNNPRKETYFAFNILSLYPGSTYDDTCFAEVNIFSKQYGWYFGEENE